MRRYRMSHATFGGISPSLLLVLGGCALLALLILLPVAAHMKKESSSSGSTSAVSPSLPAASEESADTPDPAPRPAANPVPAEAGLINPGCEEGTDQPAGWRQGASVPGVEYIWDTKEAHEGEASLCLNKTAQRYFPIAEWRQSVALNSGCSKLRLSAWIKAAQAHKAILDVQFPGGHEWAVYIGAKDAGDPPADHDWAAYEGTVSIPSGTTECTVGLQIYGPGTVWFDDISVELLK